MDHMDLGNLGDKHSLRDLHEVQENVVVEFVDVEVVALVVVEGPHNRCPRPKSCRTSCDLGSDGRKMHRNQEINPEEKKSER